MNRKHKVIPYQKGKYNFPYHFIPRKEDNNYIHARYLWNGYEYLSYVEKVIDKLKGIEFETLLDLGCGDGRFLFECISRFKGKKFIGIDVSENAVKFARIFNPRATIYHTDFTQDVPDDDLIQTADVVTLIDVLEHIAPTDIPFFLSSIHFVLKNNGTLLLTVPSNNLRLNKKHYQHFDLPGLTALLKDHFIIEEHSFLNKISLKEKLFRRLLSNRFFILNHNKMLNVAYDYYVRNMLEADKKSGKRIFLVCKKGKI